MFMRLMEHVLILLLLCSGQLSKAALVGKWLADGTRHDLSGNGQNAIFGSGVLYDFDGHFDPMPSAEFVADNDGANSWVTWNFTKPLYNVSGETLMGYVLEDGCVAPCNEPLMTLLNSTNRDMEMLAFGKFQNGSTVYEGQLIFVQRRDMGTTVHECRYGSIGQRLNWNNVAVTKSDKVRMYQNGLELSVTLDNTSATNVARGLYRCPLTYIGVNYGEFGSYRQFTGTQMVASEAAGASPGNPIGVASPYLGGLSHPMQQHMFDWQYFDTALQSWEIALQLTHTSSPSPTASATASATATSSPTSTSTASATSTTTATGTRSSTSTKSRSFTPTRTSTATETPIPTYTYTTSATSTVSTTRSATGTTSSSATPTRSATATSSSTSTHTPTATSTATGTTTSSSTSTSTATATASSSPSSTATSTVTFIPTLTPTVSSSSTASSTSSATATSTRSPSATPSSTPTASPSASTTPSLTFTPSPTPTSSPSSTSTATVTTSATPTATRTAACLPLTTDCYQCPNGLPCDDGSPLTVDDKCLNSQCLGSVMNASVADSPDGTRHFEITLRVTRDFRYQELTAIVWAVFDRYIGTSFVIPGTNSSNGLREFVEDGNSTRLLAELQIMKTAGKIKGYGLAPPSIRMTRVDLMGTEYNFLVTGSANDNLMFVASLLRSNDRFLAPLPGGMPLFVAMQPNYGEQQAFTLWDAGTEANQPYFANLYLGQQSSQQGGGIPGGVREDGLIYIVHPSDYLPQLPFNVSYPKPVEFVRLFIDPGMDVLISSSVRAQKGVTVLTEFTLEAGQMVGNEIALTFPEGFTFNELGPTVVNVTWWAWQRWANVSGGVNYNDVLDFGQPAVHLDYRSRTLFLQWPEDVAIQPNHNQAVLFSIRNIGNPNNCDAGTWQLRSRYCYTKDINQAGTFFVRQCDPDLYSLRFRATSAAPRGCNRCNACSYMYTSPRGVDVFSCEDNGKRFLRERDVGLPVFPEFFSGGAFNGRCDVGQN